MLLKLIRTQRQTLVKGTAVFMLDARVHLTSQEYGRIDHYKLGKEIVYTSAAAQRQQDMALATLDGSALGFARGLGRLALSKMHLAISIGSLVRGTHVECKDLPELMGAEEAVIQACQNLKAFLDTAATFDGREILVEFDEGKPKIVDKATIPLQIEHTPLPEEPRQIPQRFDPFTAEVEGPSVRMMDASPPEEAAAPMPMPLWQGWKAWWAARSTK
jgi:hypothetical protein